MSDPTVSVVTGAGQGIGAAIATTLAARGDRLVLASRNVDSLTEVAEEIGRAGGHASVVPLDVSDPANIERFTAQVLAEHGTPTVLVNAAGNAIAKTALDVTVEDWDFVHNVHLRGTFFVCQGLGRAMTEAGYGKIINLSSTWAVTVAPGRSVYAAAKAGVSHLTAALAVEWARLGVRVNAIAPSATLTPRMEERLRQDPARAEYFRERIPLGRLATPEDMTGAVLFLSSPQSDFITGQTLLIDGGWQYAR
ncbi:MAG TPA: glucose 1-dehydrogenase [Acidimicrobiia bacterium]|nr:glucose 1-dehydrogenase [Acidimicrobiia bacterium]